MQPHFTDEQLFVLAASPPAWKDYAEELHRAATTLWQAQSDGLIVTSDGLGRVTSKSHISRTYLLLAALSIENLLKGVIVAQRPELVANGKLSSSIAHHRLLDLAALVSDCTIDAKEGAFCQVAQEAIPYWGRYPSPLYSNKLAVERIATGEYRVTYDQLYGRLRRFLYGLIRNGWQGPHDVRLDSQVDSSLED